MGMPIVIRRNALLIPAVVIVATKRFLIGSSSAKIVDVLGICTARNTLRMSLCSCQQHGGQFGIGGCRQLQRRVGSGCPGVRPILECPAVIRDAVVNTRRSFTLLAISFLIGMRWQETCFHF
ncbi:MAG: hypothetical protein A3B74_02905 [Candidatus Kerfeldbacteria bacterium RIFCSPHIGHO2_02_FULL_42_14]|uniref:Uncharacterized protein n=1 Tax=Candidatus Kerfeldbacteria bacterium RIFCSPHIGHO2_02_FULL_42_14 TaxID=1798540 RepID=A0A1G2ASJ4_9BACT|nr:MAG: hypothetical protein A3B74_02905 [Candidatus Kerfeldbacteria bacterium RIFCSPHIGHO2_02_FULL_42_14]OGY82360.1 MAG: hypothetical protein A3E60_00295 [Candidatus Kerfeldbacteria bacterium RIFCSPHIGHO2_12_FULL_42_13]OGY84592.1 MAG: hypothetical protein A3I91_01215 [Candidatus Kerfeldbacteria bacterium RIFCSPLOWO2_02_FULL_42_19]OGY87091.1 MAG: hypothetical protein A3G01_04290 [Candidatus Kerfeldbacteria bacterium RIFCSPLOWO2_12_FULL_43_9]